MKGGATATIVGLKGGRLDPQQDFDKTVKSQYHSRMKSQNIVFGQNSLQTSPKRPTEVSHAELIQMRTCQKMIDCANKLECCYCSYLVDVD
jgi:hypothetical protein